MQTFGKSFCNALTFFSFSSSNFRNASLSGNTGLCCNICFNSATAFMADLSLGSMAKSVNRSHM